MGFVRWTIIKIVTKTDIPFSLQGIMQGPLSESDCSSCISLYQKKQYKVSKGAKIRNRYNQVPHLTQDTNGKVTNS